MKKLLSILIFTIISSTVFARGLTTVPRVTLKGMNYLNGKSATAFFVSGRAPGFSTPGSMPRVRSVFKKVGPMKISSGTVSIPSTSFIESGWSKYNYLQVIVHNPSQKTVGIRNLDGSVPYGQTWLKPNDFAAFKNIRVYFVKKDKLGRGTIDLSSY